MIGIYKITNKINGMSYIGQSIDIKRRWKEHRARRGTNPIYQDMEKLGLDKFSFEVIEQCSKDILDEREIYWIDYYDTYKNGYNQTAGGQFYKNTIKNNVFDEKYKILFNNSIKLYWLLLTHSFISEQFGDNVRIFQQRDIVLTKVKKILNMDERTIKKYWEQLEKDNLIKFCPRGWREDKYVEKVNNKGEIYHEEVSFNDRWKIRNKHKETYYEIPILNNQLFRKIPKQTIIQLNEEYCVKELTLKVYMTLVNFQEDCIYNGFTYKRFTYQDLRDMLGYTQEATINKKLEAALNELISYNLISLEKGDYTNDYGLKIPVFILNQVNFYVDFEIMDYETAPENIVPKDQIERVKKETQKDEQNFFK